MKEKKENKRVQGPDQKRKKKSKKKAMANETFRRIRLGSLENAIKGRSQRQPAESRASF